MKNLRTVFELFPPPRFVEPYISKEDRRNIRNERKHIATCEKNRKMRKKKRK